MHPQDSVDGHTLSEAPMESSLHGNPNRRITASRIRGQIISGSKVGDIITGNPATTNLGFGNVAEGIVTNATSTEFILQLSDNFHRVILAVPDVSIFVGFIDPTTQWPNPTYGMGNMPCMVFNSWGYSNNVNVVTSVVVRNDTGADINVIVAYRWRIITNSSAALGGLVKGVAS